MMSAAATSRCRHRVTAALAVALLLATGSARAGDKAMAESLFQAGKALMEQGKLDEACPKFAESMRIDPAVGSQLNLARCHELEGKTATAWAEYLHAVSLARSHGQADRAEGAARIAAELEAKLSKLTIEVPHPVPGLRVARSRVALGAEAYGLPVAVDPGRYEVRAEAPGYRSWSTSVAVGADGDRRTVIVPVLSRGDDEGSDSNALADDGGSGAATFYALARGATGIGLVGLVLGTAYGVQASSKWDDAQAQCPEAPAYCDAVGVALSEEAQDAATISTVGFVIGGLGLAGAAVLWIVAARAPAAEDDEDARLRVVPFVAAGQVGLAAGGRF